MGIRGVGVAVLVAALAVAASPASSAAARKCGARANPRSGAIEVKATGVAASPRWGVAPGGATALFADEAACFKRARLKNCHLGAGGTLAEVTPPASCQVCVSDSGPDACCAFVRGCTPGVRVQDASFAAGDPRFGGGGGPQGVWQRASGTLFADQTDAQPDLLALNADSTGSLTLRSADTGVLTCGSLLHATAGPSLLLDLTQLSLGSRLLLFAQPDGNTLQLRDTAGATAAYGRVAAVPPELQCGTFTVNARFDGLPVVPDGFSGLAFDGTSLWYEQDNTGMVFPINPGTGVLGAPIDLGVASQFTHVHAMQGADFWTHCGCGNNQSAERRTMAAATVDAVNTDTDLSDFIAIDAIAYDTVGNVLYLHGFSFDRGISRLLRVNSNAEPDVLLGAADFSLFLNSMTWDGANLWALVGSSPQAVIRIDVNAARAVATFAVPDNSVQWQGIAAVGSQLFLIGRSGATGVLVGVSH
jgi:hypothetical protein